MNIYSLPITCIKWDKTNAYKWMAKRNLEIIQKKILDDIMRQKLLKSLVVYWALLIIASKWTNPNRKWTRPIIQENSNITSISLNK